MITTSLKSAALAVIVAAAGCGAPDSGAQDTGDPETGGSEMADAASQDTGWIDLVEGSDLSAWRGYQSDEAPAGWEAADGTLAFNPDSEGGDILTREQYGDFELELEWRVSEGGNSGVFYRATEEHDVIWQSAPELQILDDAAHADGGDPLTSAGSLYALYPPTSEVVKPAGEWNRTRVVARGPHVEHWLNGTKVVEYEAWSEDWNERVAGSKFSDLPNFGEARRGHIGLQDHGDEVWYRNIRVRPLDSSTTTPEPDDQP